MIAVIIKNNPQSPPNPSTIAPEEDANKVLPAVPTEASKAYCVAVKLRSTRSDINVTNATVAKAAARSSIITANAKRTFDGPTHARRENSIFVAEIIGENFVNFFKAGNQISIKVLLLDNREATITYSLSGFTAGYNKLYSSISN